VQQTSLYWHVYENVIVGVCRNYDERVNYIKTEKPEHQREVLLRLFQPVRGSLPEEVVKAGQAHDKAEAVWDKARLAHLEAKRVRERAIQIFDGIKKDDDEIREAAKQVLLRAARAYGEAIRVYGNARQVLASTEQFYDEALDKNRQAIEELHAKECPNCPWNEITIFPAA